MKYFLNRRLDGDCYVKKEYKPSRSVDVDEIDIQHIDDLDILIDEIIEIVAYDNSDMIFDIQARDDWNPSIFIDIRGTHRELYYRLYNINTEVLEKLLEKGKIMSASKRLIKQEVIF